MMTKEQRTRQGVFWAVTIGYGLFYVCRLSINVLKKTQNNSCKIELKDHFQKKRSLSLSQLS